MTAAPPRTQPDKSSVMATLQAHPYRRPWWLRGRHGQTMFGALFRWWPRPRLQRSVWPTHDGDEIAVYELPGDRAQPTVLLMHGLEGSIHSHYMRGLAARFAKRRWNVAAFEQRSCGGVMNRTRQMYHSGFTADLDTVVRRLLARDPDMRLCVVGMSLSGNIAAKWLGELGDAAPVAVRAVAALSPPFDLTVSGLEIDRALGGFYSWQFLRSLIPKAIEKERQFPGCVDIEAVCRCKTFADFDTHATAALHGFADNRDYWQKVSCGQFLDQVRRPLLCIASRDDPFNPGATHPVESVEHSPFLHALFTAHGGHGGFVCGRLPLRPRFWAEEQIERFFAEYVQ